MSFYDMGAATKDDAVAAFDGISPGAEQLPGFQGGMLLVDRGHAKAITITFWESEDALRDSEQRASSLRHEAADRSALTITSVEAYEVALELDR